MVVGINEQGDLWRTLEMALAALDEQPARPGSRTAGPTGLEMALAALDEQPVARPSGWAWSSAQSALRREAKRAIRRVLRLEEPKDHV